MTSRVERAYSLVVVAKGAEGLIDLVLGVLLLAGPVLVVRVLLATAAELGESPSPIRTPLASAAERASDAVAVGASAVAAVLIVHGVVKVATAVCLVLRLTAVYPWAIGALAILLAVQVVAGVAAPALGTWILAALDAIVLGLVVWEYRRLRADRRAAVPAPRPAGSTGR